MFVCVRTDTVYSSSESVTAKGVLILSWRLGGVVGVDSSRREGGRYPLRVGIWIIDRVSQTTEGLNVMGTSVTVKFCHVRTILLAYIVRC